MHPLIDKFQSKAYCMFSVLYKIDLHNNLHPRRKKKKENSIFFPLFSLLTQCQGNGFSVEACTKRTVYRLSVLCYKGESFTQMNNLKVLFQISNYVT